MSEQLILLDSHTNLQVKTSFVVGAKLNLYVDKKGYNSLHKFVQYNNILTKFFKIFFFWKSFLT